jgi:hypothetical protein
MSVKAIELLQRQYALSCRAMRVNGRPDRQLQERNEELRKKLNEAKKSYKNS